MKKLIAFVALSGLLAACTTVRARYLDATFGQAAPDTHIISVQRETHLGLNHEPMIVYVDGRTAASLGGGQAINLHVSDGRHIVGIAFPARAKDGQQYELPVDVSATSQPKLQAYVSAWGYNGIKLRKLP